MGDLTDNTNEREIHEDEPELENDSLYEDPHYTWGKFKKQVEAAGVTDDMEAAYIDWDDGHGPQVHIYEGKTSFNVT